MRNYFLKQLSEHSFDQLIEKNQILRIESIWMEWDQITFQRWLGVLGHRR